MNAHFTLARRQVTTLQTDLLALEAAYAGGGSTASLNGQITAGLAALSRTSDDYESMAKREIVEAVKEKALSRVARFKDDYSTLRKQHESTKQAGTSLKATADRDQLLASSSSAIASSSSPYSTSSSRGARANGAGTPESPFTINMSGRNPPTDFAGSVHNNPRSNYALDESSFLSSTGSTLDMYIAQGQAVLGNLGTQRDVLKGTKTRLLSAANTLGLSRDTIQFIERRTQGDFYILLGGGAFTLLCFYLILRQFG